MNHFVPAWRVGDLQPNCWKNYEQGLQHELEALKQLQMSMCSVWNSSITGKSLAIETADRVCAIARFFDMNQWLQGLHAFEVPGDGNCGIWSLLCLLHGQHFTSWDNEDLQKQCDDLRVRCAEYWVEECGNPMWQEIFNATVASFDERPSSKEKKLQAGVKQEPLEEPPLPPPDLPPQPSLSEGATVKMETTPKSKKRPLPTQFIDLVTPEKDTDKNRRKVVSVGETKGLLDRREAAVRTRSDWIVGSDSLHEKKTRKQN